MSAITIKVFYLAGNTLLANLSAAQHSEFDIPMAFSPLPSGLYAVVLKTPFRSQVRKIIVE